MAVQAEQNLTTTPFIFQGHPAKRLEGQTLLQDAGRATPLATYTLMAKVAASQKWVPFTNEAATDGSAIPQGIFLGDAVAAADLVAGDVTGQTILVFGADFDQNQLVIENSKTLATVITVGTTDLRTVADHLRTLSLIPRDSINVTATA